MSISFPFWIILIPYGIAFIIVAVMALLALHHLKSYGASKWVSSFTSITYLIGTVAILLVTASLLRSTDWAASVSFSPFGGESAISDTSNLLP